MASAVNHAMDRLTQRLFFQQLRTAPEFHKLANTQLLQAAIVSGSAGFGAFVGFCVGGPIGAMIGGSLATFGGIKASHASQSDRTLLQLVCALNPAERTELWNRVEKSLMSITNLGAADITAAILRANAAPVMMIIEAFLKEAKQGGHGPPGGI